MPVFENWLVSQDLRECVNHPNIIVGDFSYYSGFYHSKKFEDHAVRYLLGDEVTRDSWDSGIFGDVDKLYIGKFCSIASGAIFMMAGNQGHRVDWISTYPFPAEIFGDNVKSGYMKSGDTYVGNDVWIGSEAMIMPGVTIGDGAVIGARAMITKDVKPYSIVVGNNQIIRMRFDEKEIEILLKIKWWDWPLNNIKESVSLLCSGDISQLSKYYKKNIEPQ